MKRLLYILFIPIVLLIYGCSWDEGPGDIIEGNEVNKEVSYFVRDSLDIGIRINELPCMNDYIKIECDSFYCNNKLVVYRNSHIYVDVYGDYIISDIDWLSEDMDNKTIQLVSKSQKQVYWCGSDVGLDSLNVKLVKRIKELSE